MINLIRLIMLNGSKIITDLTTLLLYLAKVNFFWVKA